MIQRIEIAGLHMSVGEDLRKYVARKIGRLDRFIPRAARKVVHVEVKLKEGNARGKNARTCEVIVRLPHETLTLTETTINMFAAVDIVEAKLRAALKRYKETHDNPRLHRRLINRFQASLAAD